MGDVQTHHAAVIIAFRDPATRAARAPLSDEEPRGRILLFTGIRYERMEPAGPSRASSGQPRRRRRRSS